MRPNKFIEDEGNLVITRSLLSLIYSTSEIDQIQEMIHEMLFLRKVGPLNLESLVSKEVLRSSLNLDFEIFEYQLSLGQIRYNLKIGARVSPTSSAFEVEELEIVEPTEQRVFFIYF